MTVKEFFKSSVFKCIVTLLCVLLISGVFLTIMNGLLEVTDEERFNRAINKIYGKSVNTEKLAVENYNSNAVINEAYKVKDDGNYLIKVTGLGGFENGTVTCWVVVVVKNGKVAGVQNVTIDSNKGQSYISKISQSFLDSFETNPADGFYFTTADGYLTSGASRSSNAICNAVNGAVDYVNAKLGNAAVDPYEGFAYTSNIQTRLTGHEYNAETDEVTFTVVSKGYGHTGDFTSVIVVGADKRIKSFTITVLASTNDNYNGTAQENAAAFVGKNLAELLAILNGGVEAPAYPGDNQDLFPVSGASESTYSLYNAALFATGNYDRVVAAEKGDESDE